MKKIGIDVSIDVCKAEGYMMVDSVKFTKDKPLHFTAAWPEYTGQKGYLVDVWLSWNDLVELYSQHKTSIDSLCDYEHCSPNFNDPTIDDALQLASDINAYMGLNNA